MFAFVYGTLKQGYGNNRLLAGSNFIGKGLTEGLFSLTDCGFPFATKDDIGNDKLKVFGEIYQIDDETQSWLDSLEGFPNFYTRTIERVVLNSTKTLMYAWMYHVPGTTAERHQPCPVDKDLEAYYWRTL